MANTFKADEYRLVTNKYDKVRLAYNIVELTLAIHKRNKQIRCEPIEKQLIRRVAYDVAVGTRWNTVVTMYPFTDHASIEQLNNVIRVLENMLKDLDSQNSYVLISADYRSK